MKKRYTSKLSIDETSFEVNGLLLEDDKNTGFYLLLIHLNIDHPERKRGLEVVLEIPPIYSTDPLQSEKIKLSELATSSPDIYLAWRLRKGNQGNTNAGDREDIKVNESFKITLRLDETNLSEVIVFS
ncbi:MAG: hypothetical protein ACXAEU_14915 [Candidatus Hodarchaeales archaeon]|jgi:hypothetical protein